MKEQTFIFLKQLVNSKRINDTFKRSDLIKMLISYYKPRLDSKMNSTLRTTANPVINVFINRKTLERVGLGQYKILKHIPESLKYKDIKGEYVY